MATTTATKPKFARRKLITAEELLELHSKGVRGELIRGELSETMPSGEAHGNVVAKLVYLLMTYVMPRRLGRVTASDSGVRLDRTLDTVREPDVGFFSEEKFQGAEPVAGYSEAIPDLVVEVISPSERLSAVHDKAFMWLRYGTRLVWVVNPNRRQIAVYREGEPVHTLTDTDSLDGLDVIPGFACAVSDVFDFYSD